jgi:hypothetical protein
MTLSERSWFRGASPLWPAGDGVVARFFRLTAPPLVEEQQFAKAKRIAQKEVERVKSESAERLGLSAEEPIWVASTLMWFELPPPGER